MGSKIFWFLILIALCISGYFMYDHYHQEKQMGNGDVTWVTGQPSPEEHARFLKENAGETADGQSERKIHTATEDAAAAATGTTEVGPAAATSAATPAAAVSPTAPAATPLPAAAPQATGSYTVGSGAAPASLPMTDSVPPNPANGARFTGTGSYQWYRQGNLTWRVDTVSGRSCIDYATMEEWRKPIVSSHGCGRGA